MLAPYLFPAVTIALLILMMIIYERLTMMDLSQKKVESPQVETLCHAFEKPRKIISCPFLIAFPNCAGCSITEADWNE